MRSLRNSSVNIHRFVFAAVIIVVMVLSFICFGYSGGDGIVNMADFAAFANNWLEGLYNPVYEGNFTESVYSTGSRGATGIFGGWGFSPAVWYDSATNRTYIIWTQRHYENEQYGIENFVCYYDHNTGQMSESVSAGTYYPDAIDYHGSGAVITTNSGYILAAFEKLGVVQAADRGIIAGGVGHNSQFLIVRSNAPENLSFPSIYSVPTIGPYLSYPHFFKVGNRVYLFGREANTAINSYYSDDEGANWSSAKTIVSLGADFSPTYWAYLASVNSPNNDKIRIAINEDDKTIWHEEFNRRVYYIESSDGENFTNLQGNYSHNVSAGGALTRKILNSNYLLKDTGSNNIETVVASASVAPSGRIYFLVTGTTPPGSRDIYPKIRDTSLIYFNGSQLIEKAITPFSGITLSTADDLWKTTTAWQIFAYSDDIIDLYGSVSVNGIMELQRWRTYNATADTPTWSKIEDITSGSSYDNVNAQITANANSSIPLILAAAYKNNGTSSADVRVCVKNP